MRTFNPPDDPSRAGSNPARSSKTFKSPAIHRTPFYRANAAYYGMLARCRNANGKNPAYADVELRMTRDEWVAWAVPEYEKFLAAHPDESPAAARRGDRGHYEIGNIEIVTVSVNAKSRDSGVFDEDLKKCPGCLAWKPLSHYSKHRSKPGGVQSRCRACPGPVLERPNRADS